MASSRFGMGFFHDAPSPRQAKCCSCKVNEILTACVGWIAWSDCDHQVSLKRVKIAAAGEGRACRRPAARSARRTYGPALMNALASPRPEVSNPRRKGCVGNQVGVYFLRPGEKKKKS
jgi:hypothetical protein